MPLLEAVDNDQRHGIEVVSGIILGLDTDTPATAANLVEFIDQSQIPMLTINLLQALPKTPLWDRLAAAGRLVDDDRRKSNVVFARPYDEVLDDWRFANHSRLHARGDLPSLRVEFRHTYSNRIRPPFSLRG